MAADLRDGDPCPRCEGTLRTKVHTSNWKPTAAQQYWFTWWLKCDQHHTWVAEAQKRYIREDEPRPVEGRLFD